MKGLFRIKFLLTIVSLLTVLDCLSQADLTKRLVSDLQIFRDTVGLPKLETSSVLEKAALQHLDYLKEHSRLSHFQENTKTMNPNLRVQFQGGAHTTVLENLARQGLKSIVELGQALDPSQIESVSWQIMQQWLRSKESKGHLFDPYTKEFGIAIGYSKPRHEYIVVLLMAVPPPDLPRFEEFSKVYGLKPMTNKAYQKYMGRVKEFEYRPAEVLFDVRVVNDNELYFFINDEAWFHKLFALSKDGLAVDVVVRDQFDCGMAPKQQKSGLHKGYLLPPVYAKELHSNFEINSRGELRVKVGELPKEIIGKNLELNLMLFFQKSVYQYTEFYNIERNEWELLPMPLVLDFGQNLFEQGGAADLERVLQFEVPFEKDKSVFLEEDIRPFYDSLKLHRYEISSAEIEAYSSVEGPLDRNIELQELRAQRIVEVLETLHLDTIPTTIKAKENWVEFFAGIDRTEAKDLKNKTQVEIKYALEQNGLKQRLESVLANHRKAIVKLHVVFKTGDYLGGVTQLKKDFAKSIKGGNQEEMMELQKMLLWEVSQGKVNWAEIDSIEIPTVKGNSSLLQNITAQKFEGQQEVERSIEVMERLAQLDSDNKALQYNLCVLYLLSWSQGKQIVAPRVLESSITALGKTWSMKKASARLKLNFLILQTEDYMRQKKYAQKDQTLRQIRDQFIRSKMEPADLFLLSKYLVNYAKEGWAIQILTPFVKDIKVEEDLLFYFLNLTIFRREYTQKSQYRVVVNNAIGANRERYCDLFRNSSDGGVTFQLLADPFLLDTWCEHCRE